MSENARIWREAAQAALHGVTAELADQGLPADLAAFPDEMTQLASTTSPAAAIAESTQCLEKALRRLLAGTITDDLSAMKLPQLTSRAVHLALIDSQLANSLNGLSAMHQLAATDQDRLTRRRAAQGLDYLAGALLYLLAKSGPSSMQHRTVGRAS